MWMVFPSSADVASHRQIKGPDVVLLPVALDKFSDWSCACQVFSSSVGIGLSRSLELQSLLLFSSKFLTKKSRASEARVCQASAHIIANTEELRERLIAEYGELRERCSWIPNGFDRDVLVE